MDPLTDGEGGIVMNSGSSEQKEVLELFLGQQAGGDQGSISVHLGSESLGTAPYDPVAPLPELPASTMRGDDEDDDDEEEEDDASRGAASNHGAVPQQLHIGEVDEVDDDEVMQAMHAHIKQEQDDSNDPAMSLSLTGGLESATGGVMQITSDGRVIFTPNGPETTTAPTETTSLQTIRLADGTTAFLEQNTKDASNFQAVELEDGTTALVSAGNVAMPQKQVSDNGVINAKFLEGQTVQLEDGTTAFIQAANPKANHCLHPVQLEDGSTAYLTANLFSEGQIDPNELLHQQHAAEVVASTSKVTPSRPPSERALALGEKAYRCTYDNCGRLYTTQHHLKIHERSHTGDKPFKCEMLNCGRAFATSYGLKSHIRVHTGEKPYKCPMDGCNKAFKTSGDLQKHVRTHTGEKPFKCPFEGCDRAFTTSNIRKVHIRTHTGERPYVCDYKDCKKSFASATNYKNHIRIHSGEKPYVCTVPGCGKRFTEYSSLYKHHVVHTHTKPYVCNHCGKTYRQTSTLAMHRRTAHNDDGLDDEGSRAVVMDVDLVLPPGLEAAMESASNSGLTVREQGGENDDEDSLVINTATDVQKRHASKLSILANRSSTAAAASTTTTTITPVALQNQPGLALADLSGQQIFVVTDPSQLEMIQHLTQQANFVLQADPSSTSPSSSTQSDSLKTEPTTLVKSDLLEQMDTGTSFLNTE